jgi:hypothetical protein
MSVYLVMALLLFIETHKRAGDRFHLRIKRDTLDSIASLLSCSLNFWYTFIETYGVSEQTTTSLVLHYRYSPQ